VKRTSLGGAARVTAILAASAFVVLLSPAGAIAADQGGRVVVRRARRPVSREMRELGRAQGEEFLGLALGAAVGLLAASILSVLWRRSPLAARVLAGVGLAAATALVLGPWLLTGRVNPTIVGAAIAWLLLVATLIWVFRPSVVAEKRQSLSWLRIPPSRPRAASSGRRRRPGRAEGAEEPRPLPEETGGAGAPASDRARADAARDEALAALDRGDVEGAVEGLRRSIGIRPTKRAHTLLGTMLGARGEKESALVELETALELDAGYGEALDEKARILGELGRADEAAAGGKRKARGPRSAAGAGKATGMPCLSDLPKRRPRVAAARGPGAVAPWVPAAAFSGAVVAGSLLSLLYAAGREHVAARRAIAVLDDARAGLSSSGEGAAPSVAELERRRLDIVRGNGFARDRAASLKVALAVYAYGRAKELGGPDAALSTWAAAWARRRIAEASAALSAGNRTKLPMGLADAFAAQREDFELELERRRSTGSRRREAAEALVETGRTAASSAERAARDWRSIWKRPAPGTSFLIEAFTRTSLTATGARAPVGSHADGSPLAAVGLLRCTVAPYPGGHGTGEGTEGGGGAFVLLVEPLAFSARQTEEDPDGIPPAVRLAVKKASEGSAGGGPFRIEFSPRLEFRSLASLAGEEVEEKLIVSRADLYAARELPFKSLPVFAPGLSSGWEESESYLWPYEGAVRGKGPAVKQVTHWRTQGGVTEMRIGWRMRYMLESKAYMEQVVQAWTPARAWWDFYDDGVLFFRTVFAVEKDPSMEGNER
jgi:tetratricopeptide (TPR) repeat protein